MRIKVWDLPTRVFHWVLFLAVSAALLTGLQGGNWMVWHGRLGLLIVGLLVFRLVWGVIGSTYARFIQFVPTPGRVIAYLRGQWHGLGHNPLGALSVLGLLALLLWQSVSGLFSTDDIAFDGPLEGLVDSGTSSWLTGLHRQGLWLIPALVALHLLAILFYRFIRGKDLVTPMLTGTKQTDEPDAEPARGGGPLMFVIALGVAVVAVWAANGGFLPPPPPPPPPPAW